jgi:hypothetical protein
MVSTPVGELGALELEGVERMREDNARRFPTESVVPGAIKNCETMAANPSLPSYDCACIQNLAEAQLQEGTLFNEQIRDLHEGSDTCLDRRATWDKYKMFEANDRRFQKKFDGIALAKCRDGFYDDKLDIWLFKRLDDMRRGYFDKHCPLKNFSVKP